MIAATGALVGAILAVALNLWMVQRFEMVRMADGQVLGGALLLLVLGQIAVFLPAASAGAKSAPVTALTLLARASRSASSFCSTVAKVSWLMSAVSIRCS